MANHLRKDTRKSKETTAKKPVKRAPRKKAIPVEIEVVEVIEPQIYSAPVKQDNSTYFKIVAWLKKLFGK